MSITSPSAVSENRPSGYGADRTDAAGAAAVHADHTECAASSAVAPYSGSAGAAALSADHTGRTAPSSKVKTEAVAISSPSAVAENSESGSVAVAAAIVTRADETSATGRWVGMLETMALCALNSQGVVLQFADGTTYVIHTTWLRS